MKREKQRLQGLIYREIATLRSLRQKYILVGRCVSQLSIAITNYHIFTFKGKFILFHGFRGFDPWLLSPTASGLWWSRTLLRCCSENSRIWVSFKNRIIVGIYFHFNPRCGNMGLLQRRWLWFASCSSRALIFFFFFHFR